MSTVHPDANSTRGRITVSRSESGRCSTLLLNISTPHHNAFPSTVHFAHPSRSSTIYSAPHSTDHLAAVQQSIEMAAQWQPDLVLMDVHLGSAMDGIEAAQAIRTRFGLPTVYLSAFVDSASSERAKLTEPAGYLTKPFEDYELREMVEAVLKDR